jgi:5'-deoxynucleotidase YfbR-like HD superfamily hydrolase
MKKTDTQFLTPRNKTMKTTLRNTVMPTKKTLKEKITENFVEKIVDMVNQNVQDALKKFQDTKSKEHDKTEK